jgi:hypothetical protein
VTGIRAPGGDLPRAGERWPAIAGEIAAIGAGNTPQFALITNNDAAGVVTNHFEGVMELRPAPDGMRGLRVVRPDGYVGLAARCDDTKTAEAYLASIVA